ncbi:MAG: hypothetical protein K5675_08680 [Lachnospiraceae bacterium]|nr:hypothetical protein [Lachnospiraceae bacterium]
MDKERIYTEIMTDAMTLSQLVATKAGENTPVVSITDLELILKEYLDK